MREGRGSWLSEKPTAKLYSEYKEEGHELVLVMHWSEEANMTPEG